jgi:hypothetical protein
MAGVVMADETAPPQVRRAGRLERVVALTGATSVVLLVAGDFIADVSGNGIDASLSDQALVQALREHAGEVSVGAVIITLGAVSAAVFLGSVWLQFRRASEWLAVIGIAGGLLYVMLALRLAGDYVVLASLEAVDDAVTARGVLAAGVVTTAQLPVAPLVMVITTLLAHLRYGVFPRSFLWFNVVLLALLVVAFLPVGPAGLMGLLGIAWFLVASLVFATGLVEE